MYPGALLANVGDFHHIGVKPRRSRGFAEGSLVHTGRAGADHHAGKLIFVNGFLYNVLTCLRAHILIIGGENNTGFSF